MENKNQSSEQKRTSSPERRSSPQRTGSPKRTDSPKRTGSPKRSDSPPRSRSPSPTKIETTEEVDVRQNFSEEAESDINELIHLFMVGGYQCLAMASFFDRDEISLFGMADFAKWCSTEVFHCVRVLMDYVVLRGGRVALSKIEKPRETEWKSPVDALDGALAMNQMVYDKVVEIHKRAGEQKDAHLSDFVEAAILRPLIACNRRLVVLSSNLKRAGPALGEYQFNKHLEQYLQKIMTDPNLSYVMHGGVDYLNMYRPPAHTPVDFSTTLGHLLAQTPGLVSQFSLSELINLVGTVKRGGWVQSSYYN